ncbi:Uu.00g046990.m01.CDS01 [Anthostomella pinea]|uniref:Uu.00g046990.m01.CDS01 n=1 Tax=Anthostomella pinea TaxID=933095 RepID=A0AAI8VBH1_9PEZI|nr:Uu.00g046990.m01.CDS01 [Anthostomella pinea]
MSSTTNTNPGNFANRPTKEVKEIAAMGGKASHAHDGERKGSTDPPAGRNEDGTFTKGSEAAKEAGHKGGVHSHDHDGMDKEDTGRNADGTFTKGSEAAKAAGEKGGHAS